MWRVLIIEYFQSFLELFLVASLSLSINETTHL